MVTPNEDGTLEVIDGQQRLATTTILLAAIRDFFHTDHPDNLLVQSLEDFLFKIVRETREIAPRLSLNVDDREFFTRRVLHRPGSTERNKAVATKASHNRIETAAKLAASHIRSIVGQHSPQNRADALNAWVKFIEESAEVILARCPDHENAFLMFETVNDRGAELSQADLLKNYLFSQAGGKIKESFDKWERMKSALESLGDERKMLLTYLRHEAISLFGYIVEKEMFRSIRAKVKGRLSTSDFLEKLASDAQNYVAVQTPSHAKWNEYPKGMRDSIRALNDLPVTPLRPLFLAVSRRFSGKHAERAFRLFISWSVRLLVAGGARSGSVEQAIAAQAKEVSAGHLDTTERLAESLASVIPTDAEFEAAFSVARVTSSTLARYYLRALELSENGMPEPEWVPNEDTVINLEHIYPQNPGDDGDWPSFKPEIADAFCKRLGNMVLLQASKNSAIGNAAFKAKKNRLAESSYDLTSEVAKQPDWGPEQIAERQRRLAKLAIKTWPLVAR